MAMDDILSQGKDREPGRRPRRLALVIALIAAAVAGVVYLRFPHHQAPVAAPAVSPSASASPAPATTPVTLPPPEEALPGDISGILGRTLPWASGLRLLATGTRPTWFSPASGHSEPVGGLPRSGAGYGFIRVGGGWAVQANAAASARCGDCTGPPAPVWFLADGARSATRVGTATLVAPAATPGALWLTSYRAGGSAGTAGLAREVSATGAALGPQVRLPAGYVIDQATDRGLLLAPAGPRAGTTDRLWDPATRRTSRAFAGVLAASPAEIAWTPGCARTCRVLLLDLATGRTTVVGLPAGDAAAGGAFSPGGDFLALQLTSPSTGDNGALAIRLAVAAVAGGRLTMMPDTFASSDALVGFGWPARGDSLVAEFFFATRTQLASWQPGAARPAVTVLRPGSTQGALILG
jgi:hypothetical protein